MSDPTTSPPEDLPDPKKSRKASSKKAASKASKPRNARKPKSEPVPDEPTAIEPVLPRHVLEELGRALTKSVYEIETSKGMALDARRLSGMITEYLSAFVVLGYDMEGRRIMIQHTPNATTVDGLQKFAEAVIMSGTIVKNTLDGGNGFGGPVLDPFE